MSKIKILFKSGNSIDLKVEELEVVKSNGRISKLSWTDCKPDIMFISLEDIEAVFNLG